MVAYPISSQLPQSVHRFLERAQLLDFSSLAYQLMYARCGPRWSDRQTTQAIARYLLFLCLVDCFPNLPLVPTDDIDQVWHHHILDTQKYSEDCHYLFGCFVHHFPYLGTRGEDDRKAWQRACILTQTLFRNRFGLDLGTLAADCEPLQEHYPLAPIPVSAGASLGITSSFLRPTVKVAIPEALQSLFDTAFNVEFGSSPTALRA